MTLHPSALFPQNRSKKKARLSTKADLNVKTGPSDQKLWKQRAASETAVASSAFHTAPGFETAQKEGKRHSQFNPASWWFGEGEESRRRAMSRRR